MVGPPKAGLTRTKAGLRLSCANVSPISGGGRDADQTSIGLLRKCRDRRFDVVSRIMKMHARYFDLEIRCRILSRPENRSPCLKGGIQNAHDSSEIGRNFLEQRQPLAAHFRLKCTEPGNVA